ncbi:MAG: glycosyltransferase family 2 protein [Gemmatimonadaceae bacterium]
MKISVIIPTYNYARYITEAIESVISQAIDDMEIIVIDDGSTDDTTEVLSRISDPRLRVIRTPNRGISAALNEGLNQATGEFIAFLDADDRWLPEKLERQLAIMATEPDLAVVFTNFYCFNTEGRFADDQFHFIPELRNVPTAPTAGGGQRILGDAFSQIVEFYDIPAWIQTMLFRASAVASTRFLEVERTGSRRIEMCEDLNFCLRIFRLGAVAYIYDPLVEVRRHGANVTSDMSDMPHAKLAGLQLLVTEDLERDQQRALNRRIGRGMVEVGVQDVAEGNPGSALRAFVRALSFDGARLSGLKNLILLPVRLLVRR